MKVNKLLLFLLLVAITFISVLVYENKNQDKAINDRDGLINELTNDIENRSTKVDTLIRKIESKIKIIQGDKIISVDEFINIHKNMMDSLSFYRAFYKMSRKNNNDEFVQIVDSTGNIKYRYSYMSYGMDIDSIYNILIQKNNMILNLNDSLAKIEQKNNIYKKTLDKYNIDIIILDEKNGTITFRSESAKIDSALLLLPYYRDRLSYNPEEEVWYIKTK